MIFFPINDITIMTNFERFHHCTLLLLFIPWSECITEVIIEPDGGNIIINQDKHTDLDYSEVPTNDIIGTFHHNLKTTTWENCENCEFLFLNDTYQSGGTYLFKTDQLESKININVSILETFAKHKIDEDIVIRRKLLYPERKDPFPKITGHCYHFYGVAYVNKTWNGTYERNVVFGDPFLGRVGGEVFNKCMADIGMQRSTKLKKSVFSQKFCFLDVVAKNMLDMWLPNCTEGLDNLDCTKHPNIQISQKLVTVDWNIDTDAYHHKNEIEYKLRLGRV